MLKIFSKEEMDKMGEVVDSDVLSKYDNKAFIMVETNEITEDNCITGVKGYLYVVSDFEDLPEYYKILHKAIDKSTDKHKDEKNPPLVYSFNNFKTDRGFYCAT